MLHNHDDDVNDVQGDDDDGDADDDDDDDDVNDVHGDDDDDADINDNNDDDDNKNKYNNKNNIMIKISRRHKLSAKILKPIEFKRCYLSEESTDSKQSISDDGVS